MPTITTTGNDQKLYLKEDFNGQTISLLSSGGPTFYLEVNEDSDFDSLAIRTAEASIVTSAQSGNTYTVADGTLFRIGETVPVLDSASEHKGAIRIDSISGNVLTYSPVNDSDFEAVSGDILLLRRDTLISEDAISVIATNRFKYLLVNSGSANVDLVAEVMYTGVKKKF